MKQYRREEILPGWSRWIDPETGEPVTLKAGDTEKERKLGSGRVPPTSAQASKAGYKIESRSYPCPDPGSEEGTILFSIGGKPAIWENGVLYVKR